MSALPREPAAAPPKGYRPHINTTVTLQACLLQARCPDCGEKLGALANIHRDHTPPLQLRAWDAEAGDTIPPANDPKHITLRHIDCHKAKTTGGKTKARAQGDVTEIARTKRLAEKQKEFRDRILAKGQNEPGEELPRRKPKAKIPTRKLQTRKSLPRKQHDKD